MALYKVATSGDIPPGSALAIEVAGRSVAMFNVEGVIHAIDNDCTHDGGPLSEGVVSDGCVVCPWHGAEFDLASGKALTPPAVEDVRSYKVFVSGDDISLEIDEQ
jgi:nitrite reductase/ring-hydroxylating ferredoxin subunit